MNLFLLGIGQGLSLPSSCPKCNGEVLSSIQCSNQRYVSLLDMAGFCYKLNSPILKFDLGSGRDTR